MSSEDLVPNKPLWVTLSSEIISDMILESIHHTQSSSFPVKNLPSKQNKTKKIVFKVIYKCKKDNTISFTTQKYMLRAYYVPSIVLSHC